VLINGELTSGTLNMIQAVLFEILTNAHAALLPSAYGLILAAALVEFYLNLLWILSDGFANWIKALGVVLYLGIKVAFFGFAVSQLLVWGEALLSTFQGWAFAVTGSAAMLSQAFSQPSTLWDMGFLLGQSLKTSPASILFSWDLLSYTIIVLSFLAIALHVMLAMLELRIALVSATVLIPWGLLAHTAFFSDGVIRWVGSSLVRIFILGVMVALTIVASARIPPLVHALEDLSMDTGLTLAGTALVLAILSWFLPSIAAGRVASGGGLSAGHLFGAGLVFVGAASRGVSAVRGASSMIQGSRAATFS
jgi:type IV secretory pathway TrbL component